MAKSPSDFLKSVGIALLIGIISGACGFGGGIGGGSLLAAPLGISPMEGGQGYFAFAIGILSGLVLFLVGTIGVLYLRGIRAFQLLLGLVAVLVAVGLITGGVVGYFYAASSRPINSSGLPPRLYFEVRPPPGVAQEEAFRDVELDLNTDQNSMDGVIEPVDGTAPSNLTGYVELYFRTSSRLLVLKSPRFGAKLFNLQLPADPTGSRYQTWSAWQQVDYIDTPNSEQPTRATGSPDFEIRYFVQSSNS